MTSLTYDPDLTTAGEDVATPPSDSSISPLPDARDYILVQGGFLPRDQEYYWTERWQADERTTLEEIAAGEGIDFDNAADLLRWLFSTDDD